MDLGWPDVISGALGDLQNTLQTVHRKTEAIG